MSEPLRIYADTSVFGGVFDTEFARASNQLMDQIRAGRFQLVLSGIVEAETEDAPQRVKDLLDEMASFAELVGSSAEAAELHAAYLRAGIVTERWAADALHVAIATVARCTALVSWNFRHIVHFQKVPLYNAISMVRGYAGITICSSPEVLRYAEEEAV